MPKAFSEFCAVRYTLQSGIVASLAFKLHSRWREGVNIAGPALPFLHLALYQIPVNSLKTVRFLFYICIL